MAFNFGAINIYKTSTANCVTSPMECFRHKFAIPVCLRMVREMRNQFINHSDVIIIIKPLLYTYYLFIHLIFSHVVTIVVTFCIAKKNCNSFFVVLNNLPSKLVNTTMKQNRVRLTSTNQILDPYLYCLESTLSWITTLGLLCKSSISWEQQPLTAKRKYLKSTL
jgi:hypothetical protein